MTPRTFTNLQHDLYYQVTHCQYTKSDASHSVSSLYAVPAGGQGANSNVNLRKPRNARSKRILENREPKVVENPKRTLFLRGTSASELVQTALNDIVSTLRSIPHAPFTSSQFAYHHSNNPLQHALKKPYTLKFTKKNVIYPFEDATGIEFFSTKNDTSLVLFANHSKKRPHNLTFIRLFDHRILDMVELQLDPQTFLPLSAFRNQKPAVGVKPMLLFTGSAWASHPTFIFLKSMFMDFFRGPVVDRVDVESLRYIIQFSALEPAQSENFQMGTNKPLPTIHLRTYLLSTKRSGQKLPRIELEEMGPRLDLSVGRIRTPDDDMLKQALASAKKTEPRTKKNISMDTMGDTIGRIHTGKQDLSKMQTRKMKGLKRDKYDADVVDEQDDEAMTLVGDDKDATAGNRVKRQKTK